MVVDRIPSGKAAREQFFKRLRDEAPAWMKDTWTASKRRGTDKLTMGEINSEIAAVRQRRAKKTKQSARWAGWC